MENMMKNMKQEQIALATQIFGKEANKVFNALHIASFTDDKEVQRKALNNAFGVAKRHCVRIQHEQYHAEQWMVIHCNEVIATIVAGTPMSAGIYPD